MPQKNLIIFCIISFLILILWLPLKHLIWPPPPPPLRLADQQFWAGLPGQLAIGSPPGIAGVGPAFPQLVKVGLTRGSADEKKTWLAYWSDKAKKEGDRPSKPAPAVAQKPKQVQPAVPPARHEERLLRNENMEAVVTSRGAGIRSLTLVQFKEADRMGKPVDEELHLLPDAEDGPASFLLYHFPKPDAKADDSDNPPIDTLGKLEWTIVNEKDEHKVVLKADAEVIANGQKRRVAITKTYTLQNKDYHLGLQIEFKLIDADPKESINFFYQMAGPLRMPVEGAWYTNTFRNAVIGWTKGGKIDRTLQDSRTIAFQGGAPETLRSETEQINIKFGGVATQYFASMMVLDDAQKDKNFISWARPTLETPSPDPNQLGLADITVRLNAKVELKGAEPVVHKYLLYNGPVKARLLGLLEGEKQVSSELINRYENDLHLNQLTDYGRMGFWSELIILCTNVMHRLLWFLHSYVMPWSFGLCIVMLTILVRGSMFPLSRKQALQSAKMQAKMRELAPELKQLEDKYRNDPLGLQQAKHELMMKRGINPVKMLGSCWIVLAQMPIFLGLYYALQESIYFRLAPFLWMKNLAAPDMVFRWGENIPFISHGVDMGFLGHWGPWLGPYFNIFPIIWVVLQIIQQKMIMLPPTSEQEAMQQKMMKYMMVVIGVMFYKVPAGLCLYFIASALWSLAERKLLPKSQLAPAGPRAGGGAAPARLEPAPRGRPRPKVANGDGVLQHVRILQRVKDWWERILEEAKKNASITREKKSSKKSKRNKQNQPNASSEPGA